MCNQRSNEQAETVEHASPLHLYIVVDCKTKNCRADHVLTYLGEKGKNSSKRGILDVVPSLNRVSDRRQHLRLLRGQISAKRTASASA
jgi:hypothetical protein